MQIDRIEITFPLETWKTLFCRKWFNLCMGAFAVSTFLSTSTWYYKIYPISIIHIIDIRISVSILLINNIVILNAINYGDTIVKYCLAEAHILFAVQFNSWHIYCFSIIISHHYDLLWYCNTQCYDQVN